MPTYKQFFKNRAKHDDIIPSIDPLSEEVYKFTKTQFLYGAQNEDDIEEENADEITIDSSSKHMENEESIAKSDKENNFVDWNLKRVIVGAHQGWVRSVSVDPVTNKWFATGSSDSTIKIWDLATSALKATLTGHIMGVRSLAISSKYPYLFSGSEDKTIRCWDLERTNSKAGSQIRDYYGHVGGIYAMALHPELDLLITGGRDAVIRVWDIRSRTEVMVLPGHRSDVTSIISQGVDPQIVTSSMDSTIRLWDIRKQSTISTLTQHSKSIRSMVRHPQEATICSGDSSGSIRQWVLPSCQLLNAFGESKETNIINTISINPSSNLLFAGFDNGKMQFYDYISGRCLQNTTSTAAPGSPDSAIYASTFDMSGMRLILCEGDKSVKIWGEK